MTVRAHIVSEDVSLVRVFKIGDRPKRVVKKRMADLKMCFPRKHLRVNKACHESGLRHMDAYVLNNTRRPASEWRGPRTQIRCKLRWFQW